MRIQPLLSRDEFIKFCGDRNLNASADLLHRLEELRIFAPIIRITGPDDDELVPLFDGTPTASMFEKGWIEDSSAPGIEFSVPDIDDTDSMAFYSVFQVLTLDRILQETTIPLRVHDVLASNDKDVDLQHRHQWIRTQMSESVVYLRTVPQLTALPILCQLISNRYLPRTLTNRRSYRVGPVSHFGQWMAFNSGSWDWHNYCDNWDPSQLIKSLAMDEKSLKQAHLQIVIAMQHCDPLWEWRNLLQFISQRKRNRLKGDALRAELYRQSAEMLRLLYLDLFGSDLGTPEEQLGWGGSSMPEAGVRDDPREHLKYVVNQYDLNPQPKAILLVEGESEVAFLERIFSDLFKMHYGIAGIEVINLNGVDNATGTKKEDRYGAIFRLADYHFERQTLVFIMLDNENRAEKLAEVALEKRSTFGTRYLAIPNSHEHIQVWDKCFELDNFEDEELARALTTVADERVQFAEEEIREIRSHWPKMRLSDLFNQRIDRSLPKPKLADVLVELVIQSPTFSNDTQRPIVDFLLRVSREASRNPLPLTQDVWRQNQDHLDSGTSSA